MGAALKPAEAKAHNAPSAAAPQPLSQRLSEFYQRIAPFELWLVVAVAMAVLIPGIAGYTLIDPWETHYAEVGRRILEENDWVHLRAEDQSFRSKPVWTFWLIAGFMKLFGVASEGGYSGELVSGSLPLFAVRLPFALFAVFGATMTWLMTARLISKQAAWICLAVLLGTPFYSLVARQSITDMPMVATLMGGLAFFAMAANAGDERIAKTRGGAFSRAAFFAVFALLVLFQLGYLFYYFLVAHPGVAKGVRVNPGMALWPLLIVAFLWLLSFLKPMNRDEVSSAYSWIPTPLLTPWASLRSLLRGYPIVYKRQLFMLGFFTCMGITVLAKGPPGIALTGLVCLLYTVITWGWRNLLKLELLRGMILTALIAVPWHVAMFLKDGPGWFNTYFMHHMFKRFGKGVHGDTATFDYFASQIGIGMWPWVALLPVAIYALAYSANTKTTEGRARLLIGLWAIAGVATFCVSETKFHHYIFPAIPALSLSIGLWLDGYLRRKEAGLGVVVVVALAICLFIGRDFIGEPKQLIELFIYRHDRPWPAKEPWNLDLSLAFTIFTLVFSFFLLLLPWQKLRRIAVGGLLCTGLGFGLWTSHAYMPAAAPHWGQREIHKTYYAERTIYGVDYVYYSLRNLADAWDGRRKLAVRSVIPKGMSIGDAMKIRFFVPNAQVPGDKVEVQGTVSSIGDDSFSISLPDTSSLDPLIERGKKYKRSRKKTDMQVNADRMVAWQLNWHGEDFWTAGEMYGARADTKTIFKDVDNKKFLAWLKEPERAGRTYYIITESGRAKGFRGILPSPESKESYEIIDTSCNKFTLLRFTL